MNQPASESESGHPAMPSSAPTAPLVPSPLDTLQMVLEPLPANLREILKEALIKGCSFERRGKAWRLRTRVTTADGRRQKLSLAAGHDEAYIQRLQEGVRILREAARGPRLTPEERAERAARKHRQAELRRLFLKVSHGSRERKRDAFQMLVKDGLLDMNELDARQILWAAVRKLNGQHPTTAADIMAISGTNYLQAVEPSQQKNFSAPSDNFVPKLLGDAAVVEMLKAHLGQYEQALQMPSIFAPTPRGDETAQPATPIGGACPVAKGSNDEKPVSGTAPA